MINALQTFNTKIEKELQKFTNKYKQHFPELNALDAFLRKLEKNESFFFLPNVQLELSESIIMLDTLRAIKEGKNYEELTDKTGELFGELLKKYNVKSLGEQRLQIGEKDRSKRVCRFCRKSHPEITFKNKAHAISEALGNKTLVLHEECDTCNEKFSKTIEPDIIHYLSLFRAFFNVKGKGGGKKLKGKDFKISPGENPKIELFDGNKPTIGENDYNLKLNTDHHVVLQNVYKALCKYFISVLDSNEVQYFSKTLDWINGDYTSEELPKIAEMLSYHSFSIQPKLVCYLRKVLDNSLPYAVGEFYFTCKVFVFIVPFTSLDDKDFRSKNEYEHFWKSFKHFNKSKNWSFNDYSNPNPREFNINLNFEKRKDEYSKDD